MCAWYAKLEAAYDRAVIARHGNKPNWEFVFGGMSVRAVKKTVCPHCEMSENLCIELGCPDVEARQS